MIRTFRSFSSTQWQDRNDFVHGATVQAAAVKRLSTVQAAAVKRLSKLVISVTAAYQHPLSIAIDERGHLFGLPLSQRLQLTPSHMEAWLATYNKAGQYRLTSQIKFDKRRQGTITQYLVCHTQPRRPSETI